MVFFNVFYDYYKCNFSAFYSSKWKCGVTTQLLNLALVRVFQFAYIILHQLIFFYPTFYFKNKLFKI